MSVRLLAGPFPLRKVDDNTTTTQLNIVAYWPGVGLMLVGNFTLHVATLDGFFSYVENGALHYPFSATYPFGRLNWWLPQKKMVYFGATLDRSGDQEWVLEPIGFLQQRTHPDDQLIGSSRSVVFWQYVKLSDRRIYFDANAHRIFRQMAGVTSDIPESDVFPFPFSSPQLSVGRSDTEVFVGDVSYPPQNTTGGPVACFYDTETRKISSPVYYIGMASNQIVYAPEYGVMITSHTEPIEEESPPVNGVVLRIWSLEVEPTLMSPVTAISGTPKAGHVVTYRVQVTGDQLDPAEGELVDWQLDGAGILLDMQTKTDVNGYATARVQYLLDATGPSIVTASVEC